MSSEPRLRCRPSVWPSSAPRELLCRGSSVPRGAFWCSALGPGQSAGCFLFGGACLPAAGVLTQGNCGLYLARGV